MKYLKYLLPIILLALISLLFTNCGDSGAGENYIAKSETIKNGPVRWTAYLYQIDETHYKVTFRSDLEHGWYIYSQFLESDQGPVATSFQYTASTGYKPYDSIVETSGKKVSGMDPIFEMNVTKYAKFAEFTQSFEHDNGGNTLNGGLEYMTCNDEQCLPPTPVDFVIDVKNKTITLSGGGFEVQGLNSAEYGKYGEPQSLCAPVNEAKGFWMIFALGLVGGFFALLTPCVFPMIPLTVSFFTKGGKTGGKGVFNAFFYGFCIILIYFLLSVPFLVFDISSDALNNFATNPYVNIVFFVVFVVFALSFFGLYEITLPSSVANRADKASDLGGMIGIFFMALTLAIVSFSCTGPILGSLLVGAVSVEGGKYNLVAGMLGFGVALALPFALFAAFPGFLNKMPKSGGWLNSVKVILGFIEIALAIKFISNADLVWYAGFISRELFLGLWLVISVLMALYLFGLLRFKADSKTKPGIPRLAFGAVMVAFAVYLGTGIAGKNLRLLSGFPPPMSYSWFFQPDHVETIMNDYDGALAKANEENKPLFIDFTGQACVNCRQMEENVWVEDSIRQMLEEKFIIVSLYVDQRTPLEKPYISPIFNTEIDTYGRKWWELQAANFKAVSQPWYVIISPDERILSNPIGSSSAEEFEQYLRCSLSSFEAYQKSKDGAGLGFNSLN